MYDPLGLLLELAVCNAGGRLVGTANYISEVRKLVGTRPLLLFGLGN